MAPDTLDGLGSNELQPVGSTGQESRGEAGRTEGGRRLFCDHENQPWERVSCSLYTAPSADLRVPSYLSHTRGEQTKSMRAICLLLASLLGTRCRET